MSRNYNRSQLTSCFFSDKSIITSFKATTESAWRRRDCRNVAWSVITREGKTRKTKDKEDKSVHGLPSTSHMKTHDRFPHTRVPKKNLPKHWKVCGLTDDCSGQMSHKECTSAHFPPKKTTAAIPFTTKEISAELAPSLFLPAALFGFIHCPPPKWKIHAICQITPLQENEPKQWTVGRTSIPLQSKQNAPRLGRCILW